MVGLIFSESWLSVRLLTSGYFCLESNASGRSVVVLTTLFESGREIRVDEGEANENGPKSCIVRFSKM